MTNKYFRPLYMRNLEVPVSIYYVVSLGEGGGGIRISSEGDDRMGANIKAQKKSLGLPTKLPKTCPMTNFQALKISRKQTEKSLVVLCSQNCRGREYAYTANLQIVFNTTTNPYLNQATQNNPGIGNFKQKKIRSTVHGERVYNSCHIRSQ